MNSIYVREDIERLAHELRRLGFGSSTFFVTGMTGQVGSLLVHAIAQFNRQNNDKIGFVGLARNEEKVQRLFEQDFLCSPFCRVIYQDICTPLPELNCDYIVHAASITSSKAYITKPVEVIDTICSGTRHVLELAKRQEIRGMVYLSSMEVFGRIDATARLKESELGYLNLQSVRSSYPEGKRLAECLCSAYAQEYGVPVKAARLAQTFGANVLPEDNRVYAQFARCALCGEDIVLHTRGQSVGNYVYTADAVRAILLLLVRGENGEAYSVVNENTTMTIKEMAEVAALALSGGKSRVVFEIPDSDFYGYAPDTKLRLSGRKLAQLGWRPEYDLAEMYQRMAPALQG